MQFSLPVFLTFLFLGVLQIAVGVVFGRCLPIKPSKRSGGKDADQDARLRRFTARMVELTEAVSRDVGRHRGEIGLVNDSLSAAAARQEPDMVDQVLHSVTQLIKINRQLQRQLEVAKVSLDRHTEEFVGPLPGPASSSPQTNQTDMDLDTEAVSVSTQVDTLCDDVRAKLAAMD